MAKRKLSFDILTDPRVGALSHDAVVLYLTIIMLSDKDGYVTSETLLKSMKKSELFNESVFKFNTLLMALLGSGLISAPASDLNLLHVTDWAELKPYRNNEPSSRLKVVDPLNGNRLQGARIKGSDNFVKSNTVTSKQVSLEEEINNKFPMGEKVFCWMPCRLNGGKVKYKGEPAKASSRLDNSGVERLVVEYAVLESFVEELEADDFFAGVDVRHEIKKLEFWLRDNYAKRKTISRMAGWVKARVATNVDRGWARTRQAAAYVEPERQAEAVIESGKGELPDIDEDFD